jgi:hypothetical protein
VLAESLSTVVQSSDRQSNSVLTDGAVTARGSNVSSRGSPVGQPATATDSSFHAASSDSFAEHADDAKPLAQIVQEVGTKPYLESAKEASSSIAVQGAAAGAAVATAAAATTSTLASKAKGTVSSVTAPSAATSADPHVGTLQKQLADAQREITRLQGQLKAHEARSGGPAADSSVALAQQISAAGQEGVPVHVVAMICGGVFLFTWCLVWLDRLTDL